MATADSVVVELVADVAGYQSKITAAGNATGSAMRTIESSAGRAEAAVTRSTRAVVVSSGQAANATRNLGRQVSDIGTQLAGGQSPFLIIAQQAPQVADALADTGGKAARVAAFFAGPWGAALLAAGSILGVFVGKLLESGNAEKVAEKHLHDFANAQIDLGRFIDQTTGKLIAQNRVLAQTTANRIPAQLVAKNIETQGTVNQAFAAARDVAGQKNRGGYQGDKVVGAAVDAAGGNVQRLFRIIAAAAKANPGNKELQGLVTTIGDLAGKAQTGAEGIRELQNQGAKLTTVLNGGTVATKESVDANVRRATALTATAKAQSRLADVEARWASIDAMNEGAGKAAAVKQYERDMISATKAVEAAQTATKAHNKAISEGERAAKREAAVWEKIEISTRNIGATLAKVSGGLGLKDLGLTGFLPKDDPEPTFDDVIRDARGRNDDAQEGRISVGMEAVDKAYQQQENNIRSLADLYESAFTRGTGNIVEAFRQQMVKAIAISLAKLTLSKLPGLASTLGSFLSPSPIPGRASGGYVAPYSLHRVNEAGGGELLRMGGSAGEVIPLGRAKAASGGGGVTVLQTVSVDARGAVMNDQFAAQILSRAGQQATRIAAQTGQAAYKAAPQALSRQATLGTV